MSKVLLLLAPGPIKYNFVKEGIDYYLRLISRWIKIETKFPQVKGSSLSREEKIRIESQLLKSYVPKEGFMVVLDERGKSLTTREFASLIERQTLQSKKMVFVVGGPEGLSEELRKSADFVWKLSDLTLNHELVLLIVLEALFRAISIIKGHPYHRE